MWLSRSLILATAIVFAATGQTSPTSHGDALPIHTNDEVAETGANNLLHPHHNLSRHRPPRDDDPLQRAKRAGDAHPHDPPLSKHDNFSRGSSLRQQLAAKIEQCQTVGCMDKVVAIVPPAYLVEDFNSRAWSLEEIAAAAAYEESRGAAEFDIRDNLENMFEQLGIHSDIKLERRRVRASNGETAHTVLDMFITVDGEADHGILVITRMDFHNDDDIAPAEQHLHPSDWIRILMSVLEDHLLLKWVRYVFMLPIDDVNTRAMINEAHTALEQVPFANPDPSISYNYRRMKIPTTRHSDIQEGLCMAWGIVLLGTTVTSPYQRLLKDYTNILGRPRRHAYKFVNTIHTWMLDVSVQVTSEEFEPGTVYALAMEIQFAPRLFPAVGSVEMDQMLDQIMEDAS